MKSRLGIGELVREAQPIRVFVVCFLHLDLS